jgi:hypothetical protein
LLELRSFAHEAGSAGGAIAQRVAIAALAVIAGVTLARRCHRIYTPQLLDHLSSLEITTRLAAGQPLYRDFRKMPWAPPANYGPIVPVIVAPLSHAFGRGVRAVLEAGRVVTILSTLAISLLIFCLARQIGASRASSAIIALSFIVSPLTQKYGVEYHVDMPALAFDLAGLVAFQSGYGLLTILLFAGAFFTKQNELFGIAAVALWLALTRDLWRAVTIAGSCLVVIGAGILALSLAFPFYLLNSFGGLSSFYDFTAPIVFLSQTALFNAPLFLLAGWSLWRLRLNLAGCFFLVALLGNSLSCLHWGSNIYYFLPTVAAAAILSGPTLDRLFALAAAWSSPRAALLGIGSALAISAGLIVTGVGRRSELLSAVRPPLSTDSQCMVGWDQENLNRLRSKGDGIVVTDSSQLSVIDPQLNSQFIELGVMSAMKARGTFDDRELLRLIKQRRIAAFALDPSGLDAQWRGRNTFWPELRDAIADDYEVVPSACEAVLMVPKPSLEH